MYPPTIPSWTTVEMVSRSIGVPLMFDPPLLRKCRNTLMVDSDTASVQVTRMATRGLFLRCLAQLRRGVQMLISLPSPASHKKDRGTIRCGVEDEVEESKRNHAG
jgi:hypothetical protein